MACISGACVSPKKYYKGTPLPIKFLLDTQADAVKMYVQCTEGHNKINYLYYFCVMEFA